MQYRRLARLERVVGAGRKRIDFSQLTDAELEELIATIPPEDRTRLAQLTDAELEELTNAE